jgi:DNA-directed RNA polymerase subunit N
MIPIRCFTCGEVLGDKWEEYASRLKKGEDPSKILDDIGLKRYCCRRTIVSHVEIMDDLLRYAEHLKRPGGQR